MHIAICDDNVAERKQLERLLGRESDSRKSRTGVFYTDSFGLGKQLLPRRMSYDLIFLSPTPDEPDSLSFALKLYELGLTAPIALCIKEEQYEEVAGKWDTFSSNILLIKTPILKADLSKLLDSAIKIEQNRIPTIELRTDKTTRYIKEDDFVYALSKGQYVDIYLKDGSKVTILDTIMNFYAGIATFEHIVEISRKSIVNLMYVKKRIGPFLLLQNKVRMTCDMIGLKDYKRAYGRMKYE